MLNIELNSSVKMPVVVAYRLMIVSPTNQYLTTTKGSIYGQPRFLKISGGTKYGEALNTGEYA